MQQRSEIISASFTDNYVKDNEVFKEMPGGLEPEVSQVGGDGAYDTRELWNYCERVVSQPWKAPGTTSHHPQILLKRQIL